MRNTIAAAMQAMSDLAAAVSQYFAGMAEQYRKPVIEQAEDPPVVVARSLSERRTKCRTKERRTSAR